MSAFFAFVAGAAIEVACVFWVHYSERGAPGRTAIFSMVVGAAQVLGIGESIADGRAAVAFVLGYGTGTYVAVWLKNAATSKADELT